ncbi:hypothetical protein BKA69DRAFT_1065512 [Paraphysoderma sedebokerense]|nr:hypothetical protein BKA69DRAFT_1065512 [Paraphysoderma sedebokerense]
MLQVLSPVAPTCESRMSPLEQGPPVSPWDLITCWSVFTKHKSSIEGGYRIENMSWRIWGMSKSKSLPSSDTFLSTLSSSHKQAHPSNLHFFGKQHMLPAVRPHSSTHDIPTTKDDSAILHELSPPLLPLPNHIFTKLQNRKFNVRWQDNKTVDDIFVSVLPSKSESKQSAPQSARQSPSLISSGSDSDSISSCSTSESDSELTFDAFSLSTKFLSSLFTHLPSIPSIYLSPSIPSTTCSTNPFSLPLPLSESILIHRTPRVYNLQRYFRNSEETKIGITGRYGDNGKKLRKFQITDDSDDEDY